MLLELDFLAARDAIPAKVWVLSGKEKIAVGKSVPPSGTLLDFSSEPATAFLSLSAFGSLNSGWMMGDIPGDLAQERVSQMNSRGVLSKSQCLSAVLGIPNEMQTKNTQSPPLRKERIYNKVGFSEPRLLQCI